MSLPRVLCTSLLVLALAAGGGHGGIVLVLKDGTEVEAEDFERNGDIYELRLASGDLVTLPAHLVVEIRIVDAAPRQVPPAPPPEEPRPQQLSGPEVKPPTVTEQLKAFGRPPAEFAQPTFDPHWEPRSGFTELNDPHMKPTEWARPTFDPHWEPQSGFTALNDPKMKPTEWAKPTFDPHWQPTSAWD
ncbi:MAG: hypothetical protein KBD01_15795 [Acidobacteria bacterium]|nr:hypothetical protein [Acidobacteriota bacterium]